MNILANDGISQSAIDNLTKAGFNVTTTKVEQANLINEINNKNYEVLLVRSATTARQDLIDACPNLKLIGRGGVGMDNIDVKYAESKGIKVVNTPASSSQSVAELVMAHLFSVVRFLYDANRNMPSKGATEFSSLKKKYAKGIELRGKTIGIVGFGRIGQSVAKYALGCGMKVIAFDPFVKKATISIEINGATKVDVTIETTSFEKLLTESDFITLHVPMPKDGKAVIGTAEFEKMKKGVCIINAARGGVIDEKALISALDSGTVAHAGLDVFENEPNPRADLLVHAKISSTPHIGAATDEAQERIGDELADLIITHFKK